MEPATVALLEQEAKSENRLIGDIRNYWNTHIHDLEIARHPIGTPGFFADLDEYRFDKLRYLPKVVDFDGYTGKELLEVGCGVGIDLVRFARGGAIVTGVDLADKSIQLAQKNFKQNGLHADLLRANGEDLQFGDNCFDVVYAHGVIQYTANPQQMIAELFRVVKPGGEVIMMVYNRKSWLNFMSVTVGVPLEHQDAPVLRKFSISEFKHLLRRFPSVKIVPERFPVCSKLHKGIKGLLFNNFFVPLFNLIPRPITRNTGWHIMAFAQK
ncbi:class I SAM-dependent methyltransferase [bacterium]|nr:class I SAM-dependent methyltransferase [bacterium]